MKNYIGGLFQTSEKVDTAYQTLRRAGFEDEDMQILSRKETGTRTARESVSIRFVAIGALIGAVIGTAIAAILGFLISEGILDVPAFMPLPGSFFTLNAFGLLLAQGAVTGAILGVVARLATGREKPAFTETGITHGGIILVVNADEHERERASEGMKKAGAYDVVNLSEKWNDDAWADFRELQPPSAVS